jgi:hypothetical protein
MEQEINPNSLNYVLGKIEERLEKGDRVMAELTASNKEVNRTLQSLPCVEHGRDIEKLYNDRHYRMKFRSAVKVALISVAATAIVSWIIANISGWVTAAESAGGG